MATLEGVKYLHLVWLCSDIVWQNIASYFEFIIACSQSNYVFHPYEPTKAEPNLLGRKLRLEVVYHFYTIVFRL